jgi:hypothetical protein
VTALSNPTGKVIDPKMQPDELAALVLNLTCQLPDKLNLKAQSA